MLAVRQAWGLDVLLGRAWEAGTALAGFSAGAICWFGEGLSDSWADRLAPVPGLELLSGSCCPHCSNEPERRPAFQQRIARSEMQPGTGIDDGAAVHFEGTRVARVVTVRAAANAYAVSHADGVASETPFEAERLRLGAG